MATRYTDTIFYQIELTARYCKLLGQQVFDKYDAGISVEEFGVLDSIENTNMCQRDLAKLLLKDRANTGKLLDALEKKGYIKRRLAIKNNRPVKIVEVTESGLRKREDVLNKVTPHYEVVKEKINNSDIGNVSNLLKELRNVLDETLELQI